MQMFHRLRWQPVLLLAAVACCTLRADAQVPSANVGFAPAYAPPDTGAPAALPRYTIAQPPYGQTRIAGVPLYELEDTTPPQDVLYEPTPLERYLSAALKSMWFRTEYLLWDLDEPGDVALGSPVFAVDDPTQPFNIFVNNQQITVRVFDLEHVSLKDNNGIRGTLGVPLTFGTLELSAFGLEHTTQRHTPRDKDFGTMELGFPPGAVSQPTFFIATSTFTNGSILDETGLGTNLFLYDRFFQIDFDTDVWGAEANFVTDPYVPGDGFKWRPLLGFRFLRLRERLTQQGGLDIRDENNPDIVTATLVSTIDSEVRNLMFAPQVGLRLQWVAPWFTISFEPKVALGVNAKQTTVLADQIRGIGDPTVVTTIDRQNLAAIGELGVSARVRVTESIAAFISYQEIWMANVARAGTSIYYNDFGVGAPMTGITAKSDNQFYNMRGLSLGFEVRFP
ncbi:MAG: hypothetical protein D6725_06250 [Planctomycetota bacterium]|nr:MAG: hypothetical protein D6725_06250 [Planctomycetota bacterium]